MRNERPVTSSRAYVARGQRPYSVELHIEELVLHGFPPGDRLRIAQAIERELAQLLVTQGAPPLVTRDQNLARLDAGAFEVEQGARPERIGLQVARSVYGGMDR
jgi:hypothetical protein